jgi:hypothetical protein
MVAPKNAMHEAVAADPRTVSRAYQGRGDRCRHSDNGFIFCGRNGLWLIDPEDSQGVLLLRCTQHAHAWIEAHPLPEPPS